MYLAHFANFNENPDIFSYISIVQHAKSLHGICIWIGNYGKKYLHDFII